VADIRGFPDTRFEALAESAPDAILTIDEDSTIVSANPATERIFGHKPDELIGQPLTVLIPERFRSAHEKGIARYLRTGRRNIPWTGVELPGLTRDGIEIPVEISFGEFINENGQHVFSGFIRDVSERVRYQKELEQARATAEKALKELAALGRITDAALGKASYDEMMSELLDRLREELASDSALLLLLGEDRQHLALKASAGLTSELESDIRIPLGQGVAGRIAASGEPLVIEDLSDVELISPTLREHMTSLVGVPVYSGEDVIGVLQVGSRARRLFSETDVRQLEIVAERMAGVFARLRLFEAERRSRAEAEASRRALAERETELQRVNQELQERAREERALRSMAQSITGAVRIPEVMHYIAEGALAVSGAAGAFVEQVLGLSEEVEIVATSGEGTPPVGQRVPYPGSLTADIIERREPVFLERMVGVGAAMAPYLDQHCKGCSVFVVPLFSDMDVLGALIVMRKPDEPAFDDEIVTRVRTLADLASIALRRLLALAESERRRNEAEAAVRSRDEVLSIVSHDLRNPVSTVAMSASLLQDPDLELTDEQRNKQLEIIARSAQQMNRLIQDLLDVARIEGGPLSISCRCEDPVALVTEVCDAFRPIAEEKDITFTCNIANDVPQVNADRARVLQAVSNFLNNAVKFTPAGGRITVGLERHDDGVCFSVSDTGPGIRAEELPRMFTRFWQAKKTAHLGAGLGLAIAKGIADAHHGHVWAESTIGQGSTFFLFIPANC
jgi:PAS domain S-box-containing protein